jgi:hypothetical protein
MLVFDGCVKLLRCTYELVVKVILHCVLGAVVGANEFGREDATCNDGRVNCVLDSME